MGYHEDKADGEHFAASVRYWRRAAVVTWSIFILFWVVLLTFAWWSTR